MFIFTIQESKIVRERGGMAKLDQKLYTSS